MSNEQVITRGEESRSSSTGTSRGLIERAQTRDPVAWERMVTLYAPLVLHWCRECGLREDDAADVFQEVFQSVASHLGGFSRDHPGGTFRGWLRTITRNKVNDHFRRRRREPAGVGGSEARLLLTQVPGPDTADESGNGNGAENVLLRRALEMIRAEFEPRTWQAFLETAIEGRAPRDVAADLSMTPGAVRVAKSRVLHRLRTELGDLRG
ncbi:MAG: polymerase sigma factor, sigma-70 family [Gemmataceae bacterium]|nr:polymerase sigma factor, sigma-70 family [Gemmataceae bacterium]